MSFSVKEKTAIDVAAYAQQYGISHEQASEEIQEFLRENGFQWSSGRTDIAYTTAKYLQISPDFELTFSNVISYGYASITFTRKESISLVPNKVVRIIEINCKKYNEEGVLKAIADWRNTMLKPKVGDKFICTCDDRAACGFNRGEVYTVKDVDEHDCVWFDKQWYGWACKSFPEDFELVSTKSEQPKPPLGLRPWHIADAERVVEILDAMKRYTAEHKPIPEEWMEELIEKVVIEYEQ